MEKIKVHRSKLKFVPVTIDITKLEPGGVIDGVYVAPDGRIAGSVRTGVLRLATWVII